LSNRGDRPDRAAAGKKPEKWFDYPGKPLTALPEGMDVKARRRGKLWTMQVSPLSRGAVQQLTQSLDRDGKVGLQERDFSGE
jgi:hypothetical protein